MSSLYDLVNVYDSTGTWRGQFINEETAIGWLKKHEFDLTKCEISTRRPEWDRD
jgi:hypothetical protein